MKIIIKLIKKEVSVDKVIRSDRLIHSEDIEGIGTFYYKISRSSKPEWVEKFFLGTLRCADKLKTSAASGVLLVQREYDGTHRLFAVTFGSGRYLLNDNVTESKFGLRVALNAIQNDSLRSIDFNKLDGIPSIVRTQVSRQTGIENFNINTLDNLLKSVTGSLPSARHDEIGRTMTGNDSLALRASVDVNTIMNRLDRLYALYNSDAYKRNFAWVDNIEVVDDASLIIGLDAKLFENINHRQLENIWMSVPTIIDWSEHNYFQYSGRNAEHYDDIDIETALLLKQFKDRTDITGAEFHSHSVTSYDDEGKKHGTWSLYRCLFAEMKEADKLYILNDGAWYKVSEGFYNEIEQVYASIQPSTINFIPWHPRMEDGKEKFEKEDGYNKRLAASDADFCNMDRNLLRPVPGESKIEFCDVFTKQGEIIHVKRKGGSELIGHLLNQGLVSGTVMLNESFRKKLNDTLDENGLSAWKVGVPNSDFHTGDFSIVFAVLSKDTTPKPSMPFFSKIVLSNVVKTLQGFGYKIYMNNIKKHSMIHDSLQ